VPEERYLTTVETARLLGVKTQTIYAYVSRGMLTSVRRGAGRNGSLFPLSQVERLARSRTVGPTTPAAEPIHTELTLIDDDELYYRGRRAADLARDATVESVAHLLWTGELADQPAFPAPDDLTARVRLACRALPDTARLTDQLHVGAAVLGATDPLRLDLTPRAVVRAGERLLGVLTAALPHATADTGLIVAGVPDTEADPTGRLAERLWPALTYAPPRVELLSAALILLADHDLAVSTVAARVAASARAHVYAVVAAGLGAFDGYHHGTASTLAYRFLAEATHDAPRAIAERLQTGTGIPGFGHLIYRDRDPRADMLLGMLPDVPVRALVGELATELADRSGLFPNVDLALAAIMHAYDMRPDAGETIFAIARIIGWIAHALEEYAEPTLRYRGLGLYTARRQS